MSLPRESNLTRRLRKMSYRVDPMDTALVGSAIIEINRLNNALAEEQAANSIADMAIERLNADNEALARCWSEAIQLRDEAQDWAIEQRDITHGDSDLAPIAPWEEPS